VKWCSRLKDTNCLKAAKVAEGEDGKTMTASRKKY
jgi:hypothetical protein